MSSGFHVIFVARVFEFGAIVRFKEDLGVPKCRARVHFVGVNWPVAPVTVTATIAHHGCPVFGKSDQVTHAQSISRNTAP